MLRSDAKPVRKRSPYSTAMLQAAEVLEFISARRCPFTVNDLAADMEMSNTCARRILLTVETVGWVEKTEEKRPPEIDGVPVIGQHFRALKRIRGL